MAKLFNLGISRGEYLRLQRILDDRILGGAPRLYFDWQVKGDNKQAIDDFRKFLRKRKVNEFEKEKERLTKLYHLYEETENECKRLREENEKWNNWYESNREIFNKLFSTAPPLTTTSTDTVKEEQATPDNPIDNPTKKPKKRRLFKK